MTAWHDPREHLPTEVWIGTLLAPPFLALAEWQPMSVERPWQVVALDLAIIWSHTAIVATLIALGVNFAVDRRIEHVLARLSTFIAIAVLVSWLSAYMFVPLFFAHAAHLIHLQLSIFVRTVILGLGYLLLALSVVASRAKLVTERLSTERAEKYALEMKHRAWMARVNPHFLFNTINSVLALVSEHPSQAEATLEKLAALFRHTLDVTKADQITLASEFEVVRDYLAIEKVRFGNRLEYTLELDPSLISAMVPPLLLQPLVENSIQHCISCAEHGGAIRVEATLRGSVAELLVEDRRDCGAVSRSHAGTGTGLTALRERIAVIRGASLESGAYQDGALEGFRVSIQLPVA